jgi:pyridinium-3,5-biscarboxylic acid mononucleotide sulfurtransferase
MPDALAFKNAALATLLGEMRRVLVAFSGGVDSTFLLKVAHRVLGEDVLAVTAASDTLPPGELEEAMGLATTIGARHRVIRTSEMADPAFRANPRNRCYYCKREMYRTLALLARDEGIPYILDGTTLDDLADHRPGRQAAREWGVQSPLLDVELTKAEIRELSRGLGLPTWDKPAMACLASRIPFGTPITPEALRQVAGAEQALRCFGFRQVRVRHYTEVARIEVGREEVARLLDPEVRPLVNEAVKRAGYAFVMVDLGGYRTGSLNVAQPRPEGSL